MKRSLILSFILILIISSVKTYSQCNQGDVITFQKVYGGNGNERAHSVKQTSDGGYVVVGETTSFGAGGKDFFIMKLGGNGNEEWTKTYGSSSLEDGNSISIIETSDKGYLFGGFTEGYGAGSFYDSFLIKTDSLGNEIWSKKGVGNSWEIIRDLIELSSGNYLAIGNSASFGAGNQDVHAVLLSPLGNVIWSKTYGGTSNDQGTGVMELPNGNSLISCYTTGFGAGAGDGLLIKINALGNIIWSKTYGGVGTEHYMTTNILSDGNFIGVGLTNSYGSGNYDVIVSKIDTNGNEIWTKTLGGGSVDRGANAHQNQNGEIIISGYSSSLGANNNLVLIGLDLAGNVLWSNKYGGFGNEFVDNWSKPMDVAIDNGYIVAGSTSSFGGSGEEIYVVKTNECGFSFCNELSVNLSENSPSLSVGVASLNMNTGPVYIDLTPTVNLVSFSDNFLCVDTTALTNIICNLTANFSSNSFCLGDTTYFTDTSIDSNSNIVNWKWYFGDGDSIVGVNNPSHYYTSSGVYDVTLVVSNDSNCIDSITIPITINSIFNINQTISICQGDSIVLGGSFQNSSGIYTDSLQTSFGCDSLIITTLMVNPTYSSSQSQSICQGDSLLFGGLYYNSTGIYWDSLQTVVGCDSLFSLDLLVENILQTTLNQEICQGDSIFLGGSFQYSSGTYIDTLQGVSSCDSIVSTILFVPDNVPFNFEVSICEDEYVFLAGNNQYAAGVYVDTFQTVFAGCDSIVITNLEVLPNPVMSVSDGISIEACSSTSLSVSGADSYVWSPSVNLSCNYCPNPIFTAGETTLYTVTGKANGCSSSKEILVSVDGVTELIIPNVFTPNRDGLNDGFNITGGCIENIEKQIFNRWGELLFTSTQIEESWNGRTTSGKEAPEGTYFYIFDTEVYIDGILTSKIFKGTVTLLR